jgi:hypothetical protein
MAKKTHMGEKKPNNQVIENKRECPQFDRGYLQKKSLQLASQSVENECFSFNIRNNGKISNLTAVIQ